MNPGFRLALAFNLVLTLSAASAAPKWTHGPPEDENYFPIAVWLQSPANAEKYRDLGINLYVALWKGPTAEQLATLKKAGLHVICDQNKYAREHLDDRTIIGWMHGDEPDNAQEKPDGKGYGPPILPSKIEEDYKRIQANDPSRPVLLNLGQGVAWDGWYGRGVRSNHPEDYPEYAKGCDIASFDIYPVAHDRKEVAGKLEFVAHGTKRLVNWTGNSKPVWSCIECTRIGDVERKPTPDEVKTEVWMALIHGARGLIYFAHQFKPVFREAALLDDEKMMAGVKAVNAQIRELAPVLNSPAIADAATVKSSEGDKAPIALMIRKRGADWYLFAVNMRPQATTAAFSVQGLKGAGKAEVLGESRTVKVSDGAFSDAFAPYAVHLYKVTGG